MKVGDSVRHALDEWARGNIEASMLHACNSVDGTARKVYPALGSKARFTRLLREEYAILGPMAAPGIDLENTRFPVKIERPTAPGGQPDFADVIYGIHRCTHGHGNELPEGFALIRDAQDQPGATHMELSRDGAFRMSDRVIFGLLAVAVLNPVNKDQSAQGYYLMYERQVLLLDKWWGRAANFPAIVAAGTPLGSLKLDFGNWKRS